MKHLRNTELMEKFGTVANYSVLGGIIVTFVQLEARIIFRHVGLLWVDWCLLLEERSVQPRGYLARRTLNAGNSDNCIHYR
jgi:hypothetical protein